MVDRSRIFGILDANLLFRLFFLCFYGSEVAEAQQLFLWGLWSCRSTAGAKKQPFRSQPHRCFFFFRHLIMLGVTNTGQKGRSIYRGSRNYEYHVRALDHAFFPPGIRAGTGMAPDMRPVGGPLTLALQGTGARTLPWTRLFGETPVRAPCRRSTRLRVLLSQTHVDRYRAEKCSWPWCTSSRKSRETKEKTLYAGLRNLTSYHSPWVIIPYRQIFMNTSLGPRDTI